MKLPLRSFLSTLTLLAAFTLAGAGSAHAQTAATAQFGSATEAKAMLDKAVTALKADKAKALEMFNAGTGGFKDRDLYVFCANASDGTFTAHPKLMGQKLSELKEKGGRPFGQEIMTNAQEGKTSEVAYMFPKPGTDVPVAKMSYVQKVGDQVVGVGYYKQ